MSAATEKPPDPENESGPVAGTALKIEDCNKTTHQVVSVNGDQAVVRIRKLHEEPEL